MSRTIRVNYFRTLRSSETLATSKGVLNEKGVNFLGNFSKFWHFTYSYHPLVPAPWQKAKGTADAVLGAAYLCQAIRTLPNKNRGCVF